MYKVWLVRAGIHGMSYPVGCSAVTYSSHPQAAECMDWPTPVWWSGEATLWDSINQTTHHSQHAKHYYWVQAASLHEAHLKLHFDKW